MHKRNLFDPTEPTETSFLKLSCLNHRMWCTCKLERVCWLYIIRVAFEHQFDLPHSMYIYLITQIVIYDKPWTLKKHPTTSSSRNKWNYQGIIYLYLYIIIGISIVDIPKYSRYNISNYNDQLFGYNIYIYPMTWMNIRLIPKRCTDLLWGLRCTCCGQWCLQRGGGYGQRGLEIGLPRFQVSGGVGEVLRWATNYKKRYNIISV